MTRVALTDGSGAWFDTDKAVKFSEATYWNGNNHISKATGSQWEHEALYFTASGNWVKNCWTAYDGDQGSYRQVEQSEAVRWLCTQEIFAGEQFEELPEAVREAVLSGMSSLEV